MGYDFGAVPQFEFSFIISDQVAGRDLNQEPNYSHTWKTSLLRNKMISHMATVPIPAFTFQVKRV